MNQQDDARHFAVTPDLSPAALAATRAGLLVPGDIMDCRLEHYCTGLDRLYRLYCATCPAPPWGPGLVVTPEMRCQAEVYLPLAAILPAFRHLMQRSCRHEPFLPAAAIFTALSWYDALTAMQPLPGSVNPAWLIRRLAADAGLREIFVMSALVPGRFGGEFGRYRGQMAFLQRWLQQRRAAGVRILDAACGSGEQCYELAEMLLALGHDREDSGVVGVTVEPLELAAAAHGWFPHDPHRAAAFRSRVGPLIAGRGAGVVRFLRDDLGGAVAERGRYTVVICNGLLGGPLLQESSALAAVVARLAAEMEKGGLLLAADRFHGGWRKKIPLADIVSMLAAAGLQPLPCSDGVAAIRP
jgi:hypothetical protein